MKQLLGYPPCPKCDGEVTEENKVYVPFIHVYACGKECADILLTTTFCTTDAPPPEQLKLL